MISYESEERLKKVLTWRAFSISITLMLTWLYTGSVKEASFFTVVLHLSLMLAHYLFEIYWERSKQ